MQGIIDKLKNDYNYNEHKNPLGGEGCIINTLLQKRVESRDVCETNNKLCINIFIKTAMMNDGNLIESIKIEIVAEKHGLWWTLNCYSVSKDEIFEKLEYVKNTLIKLFNTI